MRTTFRCLGCGKSFTCHENAAVMCPYCGSRELVHNERAREKALVYIAECKGLADQMAPVWAQYVELLAQYECRMQTLRTYKMRGIVQESEMPSNPKKFLREALAEYRENRKEKTDR